MDRITESPTSFSVTSHAFRRMLNSPVKPLRFDGEELDQLADSTELDIPMADLSDLRRGFGGLEVGDDSMISHTSSFMGTSPEFSESGEDLNMSSVHGCLTPSPKDRKNPKRAISSYGSYCQTPAPVASHRKGRQSLGEVPRTPIKEHRFRPRTSTNAARPDTVMYNIQEECNVNPFSSDSLLLGEMMMERQDECRKRPAADMLSTPDFLTRTSTMTTPESGYGSRHKMLKSDKVIFSLGSPLEHSCSSNLVEHTSPSGRYEAEFVQLDVIDSGHFGRVTKVKKRLDGVIYAIKRTQEEVQKTSFSDVVREVFALSALDCHPNVLRYFSSWIEGGHLYIQSEYCDAGTLGKHIEQYRSRGEKFEEEEIRRVVRQAGNGLVFLHEQMLAHLDVKPDNILISQRKKVNSDLKDGRPSSATPDGDLGIYIYKIGDLGHVRSFRNGPVQNYMDGDKGYLAPELLHDMESVLRDAAKADVYSLGVSLFEMACVNRVPNGTDIHGAAQRNGIILGIVDFPLALNQLFQRMTALEPNNRPTMYEVTSDPAIHTSHKTFTELEKDLYVAQMENLALTKELAKASRVSLKGFAPTQPKKLLMGRTKIRSVSTSVLTHGTQAAF